MRISMPVLDLCVLIWYGVLLCRYGDVIVYISRGLCTYYYFTQILEQRTVPLVQNNNITT